ncbi:MAG TPA: S41 family peptidase [Acidimicrobiia bacterium]|nr:S41 family peptidase [Acidimicrobiia bacterium]
MATRGYYRHPTIHEDRIIFVAEDDLWLVTDGGGQALRLTANPGSEAHPRFSPDGKQVAFVGRDEGRLDLFVMAADGGPARRLTNFGGITQVLCWNPQGSSVVVASDHQQPFQGWTHLWEVPIDGDPPTMLPWGPARGAAYGPDGGLVIGRNSFDPARWKRYRGGRTGSLWIDRRGDGNFVPLVRLAGNLADPMWIGNRIYFLSDHEGVGNLFSVTPGGAGLQRHTSHGDFYARFAATDGRRVVYHCGADLYVFDPDTKKTKSIDVDLPSSRPQRNRRFISPGRFFESFDLHPQGHSLALVARGTAFTAPLWEGAPRAHGQESSQRRRLARWLPDGERIISVSDQSGEESLVLERADGEGESQVLAGGFGRIRSLEVAAAGDRAALSNHRHELILVDLVSGDHEVIIRSLHSWIRGFAWSPDGRWLAFAAAETRPTTSLFLYDTSNKSTLRLGRNDFEDWSPTFDHEGKYLSFLSARAFEPIADGHFHDYSFPRAVLPMLMTLKADTPSPFSPAWRDARPPGGVGPTPSPEAAAPEVAVEIDLDGISSRVIAYPTPPGVYVDIRWGRSRTYLLSRPLAGAPPALEEEGPRGRLECWDFATDKLEVVAENLAGFDVSADGKVLAVRGRRSLRVVPVGWKNDKNDNDKPGRESGLIDLGRFRLEINPAAEWRQMLDEAWRLQRDYFWVADMSGVNWEEVRARYARLIERVGARSEFSDLMWEMQGELGTSHAYELGGDYRPPPTWSQGHLGADLLYERKAWRVARIPHGDSWDSGASSPLSAPGVNVKEGDRLLEVNGVVLGPKAHPRSHLVERARRPVNLKVARGRQRPRTVVVVPLGDETLLRYRDWVEGNRERVREESGGAAGYIHIPDMGPRGFAEFHRYWKSEVDYPGLVIDVRFNGGGNVSQLLMEKLVRRRLGFRVARWRQPYPFPDSSPAGPMVCLTNENAGSDGDIFSHTFKMLGMGPLIGTRTWGGVVGIWPQQALVDGTVTTQPEFGTWFSDVGYAVENYGTDPDIEVVFKPQDYAAGRDPQLERGVREVLKLIKKTPPIPSLTPQPSL